jgi:hypothetical protein
VCNVGTAGLQVANLNLYNQGARDNWNMYNT